MSRLSFEAKVVRLAGLAVRREAPPRLELRDSGVVADQMVALDFALTALVAEALPGPRLSRLASTCADDRPTGEARPA